jgi:hypothetical protein
VENQDFDHMARNLAAGVSRRSVLRRAADSAIAGSLNLAAFSIARADGKDKNKNKDKNGKDKNNGQPPGQVVISAQGGTASATSSAPVVQNSNQVCAGNCDQTSQQVVDNSVTQSVLTGSTDLGARPPTYFVDMRCTYDAPSYRTVCDGTTRGQEGAPLVQKINLPTAGFCAIVTDEVSRPEKRETVTRTLPAPSSGNASAGNGGVANASANGGSVSIGDVSGSNDIAIDASGGTANADASGGDNNVAVVGGNQATQTLEQVVEPSTITVTLEGNVVPGKSTTYWLDTAAGRRPAAGPSLIQVADETNDTGAIVIDTWTCPIGVAQPGFDWFGQCTTPATDMQFSVYPATGGTTPLATSKANAQGNVRFGNLPPGTYQLRPEGTIWCYAEGDRLDPSGNVIVESQAESHVWSFVCSGGGGS